MTEWEKYDLTSKEQEEYDMLNMSDDFYEELSEADIIAMYIDFLSITPDNESDVNKWVRMHELATSAQALCNNSHYLHYNMAVRQASYEIADALDEGGIDVEQRFVDDDTFPIFTQVVQNGCEAAAEAGIDWADALSGNQAYKDIMDKGYDIMSYSEMIYSKLIDEEEWSFDEIKLLNEHMRDEIEIIHDERLRIDTNYELQLFQSEHIEETRERDGIQGDEPNLPWSIACKYLFGNDVETIQEDAKRELENKKYDLKDREVQLFETAFELEFGGLMDLPSDVYPSLNSWLEPETYDALGSAYSAYVDHEIEKKSHNSNIFKDVTPFDSINLFKEINNTEDNREMIFEQTKDIDRSQENETADEIDNERRLPSDIEELYSKAKQDSRNHNQSLNNKYD